jgi:hypothetical protein
MHVFTWDEETQQMRPMTQEEYAAHLLEVEKNVKATDETPSAD